MYRRGVAQVQPRFEVFRGPELLFFTRPVFEGLAITVLERSIKGDSVTHHEIEQPVGLNKHNTI